MTTPARIQSPSFSEEMVDDDNMAKSAVSLKKIKLDLIPKESENDVKEKELEEGEFTDELPKGDEETFSENKTWLEKWAMQGVWHHFAYCMIPIDVESWYEHSYFSRFLQILQVPIFLVFRLTIPTVLEELPDETFSEETESIPDTKPVEQDQMSTVLEEPEPDQSSSNGEEIVESSETIPTSTETAFDHMHGWCKPLNVAQCVIVPTLCPLLLTCKSAKFCMIYFIIMNFSYLPHLN